VAGGDAAGRDAAGRGGSLDTDTDATGRDGAATATLRANTSGQAEKRPVQTVSQIAQVQAAAPAFIGWLQPLVIWQPNSWHQPIGRPS
jgi:hypothetical protein